MLETLLNALQPQQVGAQQTGTPASVERLRKIADALVARGVDYSPVQSGWQGAARVAQAMLGGYEERQADQREQAGIAADRQMYGGMAGALMGGSPASAGPPIAGAAPITPSPTADAASPMPPQTIPARAPITGPQDAADASPGPQPPQQASNFDFGQAKKGIDAIEGGNYGAMGPVILKGPNAGHRAYGAEQVMDFNVPDWTEKYYGQRLTPQEYLKNPDAQNAVFKGEFGRLAQKYGPEAAAQAWLGGEGSIGKLARADQNGTTVGGYGHRFMQVYGAPQNGPDPRAAGQVASLGPVPVPMGGPQSGGPAGLTPDQQKAYPVPGAAGKLLNPELPADDPANQVWQPGATAMDPSQRLAQQRPPSPLGVDDGTIAPDPPNAAPPTLQGLSSYGSALKGYTPGAMPPDAGTQPPRNPLAPLSPRDEAAVNGLGPVGDTDVNPWALRPYTGPQIDPGTIQDAPLPPGAIPPADPAAKVAAALQGAPRAPVGGGAYPQVAQALAGRGAPPVDPGAKDSVTQVLIARQGGAPPAAAQQVAQAAPQPTAVPPQGPAGGDQVRAAMAALANPWASEATRQMATMILQREMQSRDPMRILEMQKLRQEMAGGTPQEQQLRQLQIQQAQQSITDPKTATVGNTVFDLRAGKPIYQAPQNPQTVGEGQVLVDPNTGKPIYQAPARGIPVTPGDAVVNPMTGEQIYKGTGFKPGDVSEMRKEMQALPSYKNYTASLPAWQSMVEASGRDTAASDLNLVYGIAKIMDPTSVVRGGEIQMANDTQGVVGKLNGMIASINGGARLQPEARQNLMMEGLSRMKGFKTSMDADLKGYTGIVQRRGMNLDDVLPSLPELAPYASPPPPDPSAGSSVIPPQGPVAPPPQLAPGGPPTRGDMVPGAPPVAPPQAAPAPPQPSGQATPNAPAIRLLRSDPSLRDQFDAKYGKGAAARILGGQ